MLRVGFGVWAGIDGIGVTKYKKVGVGVGLFIVKR